MVIVASWCPKCNHKTTQEIYKACPRERKEPWVYSTKLCLNCGTFIDMITSWEETPHPEKVENLERRNCGQY